MSIDDDDEIYDLHDYDDIPLTDLFNDVIDKDGYSTWAVTRPVEEYTFTSYCSEKVLKYGRLICDVIVNIKITIT